MSLTFHIVNFGCQMNSYEAELMEGILEARGWQRVGVEREADVLLYNTCVVRDHAEKRALARLGQLKKLKDERPEMILGVCGCLAQKDAQRLLERLPFVDLVMGPRAIARLGALLDAVLAGGGPQVCLDVLDDPYPHDATPHRKHRLKALTPIMYGCDNFCTYCIVPATRGREVSRPADEILDEIRDLVARGYREITLVGQNVNSYRADGLDFAGLLRRASAAAGEAWIRYITSHPRDCGAEHIAAVAECANVCENFHLPVQAGSNPVLEKMGRGYTREHYLERVERIRAAVPGATLTTDLMVGFPGEGEAEFEETLDLARRVRFDAAYMYMYSSRPGTPAAEAFADQIPTAAKKERLARLIELQERIGLEINRGLIGSAQRVLVEDEAPRTAGDLLARTRGDKMVILHGPTAWIGRFMDVTIDDANGHTLFARSR